MDSGSQLSFNSEHRLRSENLSWDLDVWYPLVKDVTFRTIFIPLTLCEAKAIQAFHDVSWRHLRKHLTEYEILTLRSLEEDVDKQIRSEFPHGAFVRLCGRSPKDGEPLYKERILHQYEENLRATESSHPDYDITTRKMIAIAQTNYLKVYSGSEVMSLLLTSERVYADMIDWIKYGEPEQICLRDWSPEMSMDYEFRVFVCSDTITAISQYDHYSYYPHLSREVDFLKEGIEGLWKKFHYRVGVGSYIFDVAYLSKSKNFIVIEFSPFFPCTGPALFNWTLDQDVLEGRLPFEFRLKSKDDLHPQIEDLLESNWDDRWKQIINAPPYFSYYDVSAEDAEALSRSRFSPRQRRILINIGVAYMCSCVVGIFTTVIYLIKLSNRQILTSAHQELKSSFISSVAFLLPMYFVSGGLFSPSTSIPKSRLQVKSVLDDPSSSLLFVYGTLKRGFQWNQKYLHNRGGRGAIFISGATTRDRHRLVIGDSGVPYLCLNSFIPDDSEECSCNSSSTLGNPIENCTCRCQSCQHDIHRPRRSWTGDTAATSLAATTIGATSATLWTKSSVSPPSTNRAVALVGERISGEIWKVSSECLRNLDDYEGISKQYYQRRKISVQLHDETNTLMIAYVYCVQTLPDHLSDGPFLEEYTLAYHKEFYRPISHIQVKQLNYIQTISTWGNVQEEKMSTKGMENVKN